MSEDRPTPASGSRAPNNNSTNASDKTNPALAFFTDMSSMNFLHPHHQLQLSARLAGAASAATNSMNSGGVGESNNTTTTGGSAPANPSTNSNGPSKGALSNSGASSTSGAPPAVPPPVAGGTSTSAGSKDPSFHSLHLPTPNIGSSSGMIPSVLSASLQQSFFNQMMGGYPAMQLMDHSRPPFPFPFMMGATQPFESQLQGMANAVVSSSSGATTTAKATTGGKSKKRASSTIESDDAASEIVMNLKKAKQSIAAVSENGDDDLSIDQNIDEMDPSDVRRKKNRIHAKKARARKKEFISGLEDQVKELVTQNNVLRSFIRGVTGKDPDEVLSYGKTPSSVIQVREASMDVTNRASHVSEMLDITNFQSLEHRVNPMDLYFLKSLLDANHSFVITNPNLKDNPIIYCSDGFVRLTGYPQVEILGRNCRFLQGEKTDRRTISEIKKSINDGKHVVSCLKNYKKDGTPFWNYLSVSPMKDPKGNVLLSIGVQCEVFHESARESVIPVMHLPSSITAHLGINVGPASASGSGSDKS
jgi:PAS domain S-box-containing protein